MTVFDPTSPGAKVIADLFLAVLAICGVILLVVTAAQVDDLVACFKELR